MTTTPPMRILRSYRHIPESAHGAVLALGNFDAVHRGHRAVLAEARALATRYHAPLAVMTFEPHPRRVFAPDLPPLRIVSFADKARLLAAQGIDWLHAVHFTHAFARTRAQHFITDILHENLHARHIVTGENFTFGHKRAGNPALLQTHCAALGMGYTAVQKAGNTETTYSSTAIREALLAGEIATAHAILGRPYRIHRRVIHGDKRGRELGYPTANLPLGHLFCPRHGVYAVRVWREGSTEPLPGVASLGLRPMFALERPLLEVHLFDVNETLYGEALTVEPVAFLRAEEKFSSTDALITAMQEDENRAREMLT